MELGNILSLISVVLNGDWGLTADSWLVWYESGVGCHRGSDGRRGDESAIIWTRLARNHIDRVGRHKPAARCRVCRLGRVPRRIDTIVEGRVRTKSRLIGPRFRRLLQRETYGTGGAAAIFPMGDNLPGAGTMGNLTTFPRVTCCHVLENIFHRAAMWKSTLRPIIVVRLCLPPLAFVGVKKKDKLLLYQLTLFWIRSVGRGWVCRRSYSDRARRRRTAA